jgi:hypothetical protein
LTNDQKQWHVNVCLELREKANEDQTFISRIITGNESWIYGYDPETATIVTEPTIIKSKKGAAGPEFNEEHASCCCFFDVKGIVHHEFAPPDTMVNSDFY